ncbi:hypothetical protein J4205_02760 [Candidatus Pacearchaeota archaeon]|nr:hypothetical protein [Candidatus Pacearchaeota archaeon]
MKEFREFLNKGIIKKQTANKSRANDLIEESERKEKSLKEILNKIGLSNNNSNDILEYCYDILIGLIRAKLYLDGFKSSGEGSHEAEISYLKEIGFSETEAKVMDELRYFRNGIKYYGKRFDSEYAKKILKFSGETSIRLKHLFK